MKPEVVFSTARNEPISESSIRAELRECTALFERVACSKIDDHAPYKSPDYGGAPVPLAPWVDPEKSDMAGQVYLRSLHRGVPPIAPRRTKQETMAITAEMLREVRDTDLSTYGERRRAAGHLAKVRNNCRIIGGAL